MLARLPCCSDERSLQDSLNRPNWQLRRSLGRSRPPVQVQSRILQNISNREKCEPTDADYIYFTSPQTNCGLKQHNKQKQKNRRKRKIITLVSHDHTTAPHPTHTRNKVIQHKGKKKTRTRNKNKRYIQMNY